MTTGRTARTWLTAPAFAVLAALATTAADASVYIDTSPFAESDIDTEALASGLRHGILSGAYDSHEVTLAAAPAEPGSAVTLVPVTAASFAAMSSGEQSQVVDRLSEYYRAEFLRNYRAKVNTVTNDLADVPFFGRIGIGIRGLPQIVDAENLLTEYAQTWAYRSSLRDGPNCWHTAVASTNSGWREHRYMNPEEYWCHMRTSYSRLSVSSLSQLQFGDVIRFSTSSSGGEVHGFTYLGPDSQDRTKHIVFTKNGYARNQFLFQDYDTVVRIYPGNVVSYFRSSGRAIDPATATGSACEDEYDSESLPPRVEADPIILAGMRQKSPRSLAPIVLD